MNTEPEGFYCPARIDSLTSYFSRSFPDDGTLTYRSGFLKNIGYSLQYLEYLDNLLAEETLHATVKTQTQKTFIFTAMGIVEAILWYVLRRNQLQKTEDWAEAHELTCNEFTDGDKKRRIRVVIEDRLDDPVESEMTLDSMRKRVEDKKLLGIDGQVYRDLNHLRKLRNRVHIQAVQHDKDTDWWNFNNSDVQLMKKALFSIISCKLFSASSDKIDIFAYIRPSNEA